ncbi:MAG: type II toxin-antitoxin system RelE/ParE family toxin [Candidatus Omnitrophica bacterium]|nr:type II toxin-antitoxin system RelE/ParE family toxin [Candidatus Omnitrophota bacterium]
MKHPLVVEDALRELIRHLPPEIKKRIHYGLEEIARDPHSGKALSEELSGLRSYKIGKLRIIYRIQERSIALVVLGPRKTIYQQAALEIKRKAQWRNR